MRKSYLAALFICLIGFVSKAFAYSDCSPTVPVVPCQKIGAPSVVYDAFGYSARLNSSNNYFDAWGQLVFYNTATHAGVLGAPSGNQSVSAVRRSGFPTATVLRYNVNLQTGVVYSGPTYSASGSWFKEIWPNSSWYPTLHIGDFQWVQPTASYLSFPIDGLTAYNAPVSSVMDHSMTTPYAEDDIVLAFNGERGDKSNGFNLGCYKKSGGGDFGSGFNYVGTTGTGGRPYFCYDGHPGYDYPQASGVDILAPAAGKLCVATTNITQQSPANVWRSPTACGNIPDVVTERWLDTGGFNAFYIFYTEYINGTTDDYMTVFLHSNNLENTIVWSTVASQGYVIVTRGQHIADVGSVGAGTANHMHLEVYKKVDGAWTRVDPYGDGTNNILWQH